MDDETYMNIELLLITVSLGLFLMVVWVVMQFFKSKARFVHQLTIKLLEVT